MTTTFQLEANELNDEFFNRLKAMFKDRKLAITVKTKMDETEYLLSTEANRKNLMESIAQADAGKTIRVDLDKMMRKHNVK